MAKINKAPIRVPKSVSPSSVRIAKERGVLGRYLRRYLRNIVDPDDGKTTPVVLAQLRILSDTDLAGLFVAASLKGFSNATVARKFRTKLRGIPQPDLYKALTAFRLQTANMVTAFTADTAVKQNPALMRNLQQSVKQMGKIAEKVDAYGDMQWALRQQKIKLKKLIEKEAACDFLRDYTSEAMELFVRTAKEIVHIEMKLGVRDMVPDEFTVKINQSVSGHISHKVEPIGRNKMMEAAQTFSKLLEGPVFDAEYEEIPEKDS